MRSGYCEGVEERSCCEDRLSDSKNFVGKFIFNMFVDLKPVEIFVNWSDTSELRSLNNSAKKIEDCDTENYSRTSPLSWLSFRRHLSHEPSPKSGNLLQ